MVNMKKYKHFSTAALIAAVVANFSFLVFRIYVTAKLDFNSDGATTNLYAEEILKSGQLFPPGWGYMSTPV